MANRKGKASNAGGLNEFGKLKKSFHKQFKKTTKLADARHTHWRTIVQREVDKLYHSMQYMVNCKLTDAQYENPEEAIFGVLCLLGDCVLADKWLSQHSKIIRFDFQLFNFCERIEEWLIDMRGQFCTAECKPATMTGLALCLLEKVCAERLEGCTVLHLAALSGDNNMVVAVTTIWEEVVRDMLNSTKMQLARRPDDTGVKQRVEDLESDWRQRNTLGETPYELVPECCSSGQPLYCFCSASFNDVPCTSHNARKSLLVSTETQAPLLFSGFSAILVVSIVIGIVSLHTNGNNRKSEPWSLTEWGGICLSYILLWIVLSLSSFIKHLWSVLTFGLVILDVIPVPASARPPPSAPNIAKIKKRRLSMRLERILAMVIAAESPSKADLNLLEDALCIPGLKPGQKLTAEDILGEDLVRNARELLAARRESRRRTKELAEMRNLANQRISNLTYLENQLRTDVQGPLSHDFRAKVQRELMAAEHYCLRDKRDREEEDNMNIMRKFCQVARLLDLRDKLQHALEDPRDDLFEIMVTRCREARIQDSHAVKARLSAIDEPRTVISKLNEALSAPLLDVDKLQKALAAAQDCPSRPDLVACIEKVTTVLSALSTLELAKSNGRKAHAQLLVSSDHDISHIAKLENELAVFSEVCLDARKGLQEPKNVKDVLNLLEKWRREEGPSRELKAAVAGTDLESLRKAISAAKKSGIGIKAAKKRLAALESSERIKSELETALARQDTMKLKEAVKQAASVGIDVTDAKVVLDKLTLRDGCREHLAAACQSNREDKLLSAIAEARKQGIDCAEAQQQLDSLMKKRLTDSKLKQEARAARREKMQSDLRKLVEDPESSMSELADAARLARAVDADISVATEVLKQRITTNLEGSIQPTNGKKDIDKLSEAIRAASLLDGFGVEVDVSEAKKTVEAWSKQERSCKQLAHASSNVRKLVDDRTIYVLEEALKTASSILDANDPSYVEATKCLEEAKALLDLRGSQRTCRVTHEQNCMMHPRLDKPEPGVPDYITAFRDALNRSEGKVSTADLEEMRKQTDVWEEESSLIFELRDAVAARNATRLQKAIDDAQEKSKSINIEPPKRTLDKLHKLVKKQAVAKRLEEAVNDKHNWGQLNETIEEAKAFGVNTYDASVVLLSWKNEARLLLNRARASRDKTRVREVIDTVSGMGLANIPEWLEAKRFLEGRTLNPKPTKPIRSGGGAGSDEEPETPKHPRWKTEICNHWLMHGYCSYGKERCNFAHGEDDLRKPSYYKSEASKDVEDKDAESEAGSHHSTDSAEPAHSAPEVSAWQTPPNTDPASPAMPRAAPKVEKEELTVEKSQTQLPFEVDVASTDPWASQSSKFEHTSSLFQSLTGFNGSFGPLTSDDLKDKNPEDAFRVDPMFTSAESVVESVFGSGRLSDEIKHRNWPGEDHLETLGNFGGGKRSLRADVTPFSPAQPDQVPESGWSGAPPVGEWSAGSLPPSSKTDWSATADTRQQAWRPLIQRGSLAATFTKL